MLWHMTIGQAFLAIHYATEKPDDEAPKKPSEMSPEELSEYRQQLREQYGDIGG